MRLLLPLALCAALAACGTAGPGGEDGGPLQVTAAFYPYAFLVERVGGADVELSTLTRPGAEPHDLELTPKQVGALGESDLVVYAAGFQPALDDAVAQQAADHAFDAGSAVELLEGSGPGSDGEGADPHLWLDPTRYAEVADALADRLADLRPERAAAFAQRAAALRTDLKSLDREIAAGLRTCARREVVTSHDAFGYLAARYDLEQIAVTGIRPEQEPTPRRLADVARLAEERGVTTVFFEELVSPRTAESLAREVGAKAAVLSPLEGPPEQGDYLTAMRTNLQTLRTALGCT